MALCDVCNQAVAPGHGTEYTADGFRSIVAAGFEPGPEMSMRAAMFGIPADRMLEQWKHDLVANSTTGWLLCPTCAARAARFRTPALTGSPLRSSPSPAAATTSLPPAPSTETAPLPPAPTPWAPPIGPPTSGRRRGNSRAARIVAAVAAVALGGVLVWNALSSDVPSTDGVDGDGVDGGGDGQPPGVPSSGELVRTFAPVCRGTGVEQATAYGVALPGPHPVVVMLASGKSFALTGKVPEAWTPDSIEETELVACATPVKRKVIQVCEYNGPDITRYRVTQTFTVRSALTGKALGRFILSDDPRACSFSEPYDLDELSGEIRWKAVEKHLDDLVS